MDHTPSKQAAKTIEIRAPPEHRPATVTWLESAHFIGWNRWIEFGKLLCFGGGESPVVGIERDAQRGSIRSWRARKRLRGSSTALAVRPAGAVHAGSCSSCPSGRAALSATRPGRPKPAATEMPVLAAWFCPTLGANL